MQNPTGVIGRASTLVRVARKTATFVHHRRRERRAFAAMPKPVSWDWARARLLPLLAGPYFDTPGEELVRGIVEPGVTVAFAIDLGHGVAPYVDVGVAQRWECSAEQIRDTAMENLRRRASNIPGRWVATGTLSGHAIRLLQRPRGWAASVLLVPEELKRLFGTHDQVLAAAGQSTLISAPISIATPAFTHLVMELEIEELYPLMLDPFGLINGELRWGGQADPDELEDFLGS